MTAKNLKHLDLTLEKWGLVINQGAILLSHNQLEKKIKVEIKIEKLTNIQTFHISTCVTQERKQIYFSSRFDVECGET